MVMLQLSFLSESSKPFCAQFMRFSSLQIQCFLVAFPFEMSHKSLIFAGHCLLVAKLLSYLISFSKGIRLSPDTFYLWGWRDFGGLTKNNTRNLPPGSPFHIHLVFLCMLLIEFKRIGQPLWAWKKFDWVKCLWLGTSPAAMLVSGCMFVWWGWSHPEFWPSWTQSTEDSCTQSLLSGVGGGKVS